MIVDREKITMTDDEIEQLFSDEFQIGCAVDDLEFYEPGEMDRIRAARKNWTDPGTTLDDSPGRLELDRVQATRGQRRQTLCAMVICGFEAVYCC
jgi:hypothetical protein